MLLNKGFVLSCEATPPAYKYKSLYNGKNMPENSSYVTRCYVDTSEMSINLGTPYNENAIVLKKEHVTSVLEFEVN